MCMMANASSTNVYIHLKFKSIVARESRFNRQLMTIQIKCPRTQHGVHIENGFYSLTRGPIWDSRHFKSNIFVPEIGPQEQYVAHLVAGFNGGALNTAPIFSSH